MMANGGRARGRNEGAADMRKFITRLLRDDEGQDLVEYVLLVSLIALAVAAAFPPVTAAITGVFNSVSAAINGGGGGGAP
jgi:Flp pilus assembly pilin Flp